MARYVDTIHWVEWFTRVYHAMYDVPLGTRRDNGLLVSIYGTVYEQCEHQHAHYALLLSLFFLPVLQAILMTMPSMCADETHCSSAFDSVEFVAVIIFTIEYAMRIYAAPEAYPVSMDSYTPSLCKLLLVVVVVVMLSQV